MGLYRRPESPIWWMSFSADGMQYRKSTGTANRKLAKKILAKVETQIVEGKWFDVDKARQYTFDDMMDRFMNEHAPTKEPKTQKSYRNSLAHLTPFFSGMTLDKLDTDEVMRYVTYRREQTCQTGTSECEKCKQRPETDDCQKLREKRKCRPGTRNRELALLSKAFNLARLWKWTKVNPCQLIKREKEDNEIGRCLSEDEEEKLVDACKFYLDGQLREMVIIALNTGIREGEVLKMRWERIDLFRKTFESYNEKTNSWRTVPMNDTVYDLLKERAKAKSMSGYVFTTSQDTPIIARNLMREWYKALNRAGLKGFRFHDLRHTVGTRLGRAGQDIHTIASILDHSQLSTTRRYVKHNTDSMRKGLSVLDRKHV
jgi:integrase